MMFRAIPPGPMIRFAPIIRVTRPPPHVNMAKWPVFVVIRMPGVLFSISMRWNSSCVVVIVPAGSCDGISPVHEVPNTFSAQPWSERVFSLLRSW
jgi:hypothetical protein